MAEANVHKQDFTTRNLLTRSVTLYPARAQVMRDIDGITLKPGTNDITIYGLTPTADVSSVKVDGRGLATITDMQIELMPSRKFFEDVYPLESDNEDIKESELIRTLNKKSTQNEESFEFAREDKTPASSRLAILKNLGRILEKDRPGDLEVCVLTYSEERQKAFKDHSASDTRIQPFELERTKIKKKQAKALLAGEKEKAKAAKEKAKKPEKDNRACQEKVDTKRRLADERIQFWPLKVNRVILSLDTNTEIIPASSC